MGKRWATFGTVQLSLKAWLALYDLDNVDRGAVDANTIALAFSDKRARQWRDIADRALGGIGFVFSDDPEHFSPPIITINGDGRTELNTLIVVGRRRDLSAAAVSRARHPEYADVVDV